MPGSTDSCWPLAASTSGIALVAKSHTLPPGRGDAHVRPLVEYKAWLRLPAGGNLQDQSGSKAPQGVSQGCARSSLLRVSLYLLCSIYLLPTEGEFMGSPNEHPSLRMLNSISVCILGKAQAEP